MNWSALMSNPYLWLLTSFCTVAAFIYGFYQAYKSKRVKQYAFTKNSNVVILAGKTTIDGLDISYKKQNIENLSISKFAIWNSGNEVITQTSDIVSDLPLRIVSKSSETVILECNIVKESEPSNKFEVISSTASESILSFDYTAPKEGVIVQVIHTGDANNLTIDYKIKGGKDAKEINRDAQTPSSDQRKRMKKVSLILAVIGIICILILVVLESYSFSILLAKSESFTEKGMLFINCFQFLACFAAMSLFITEIYTYFHLKLPAELRDIYND